MPASVPVPEVRTKVVEERVSDVVVPVPVPAPVSGLSTKVV